MKKNSQKKPVSPKAGSSKARKKPLRTLKKIIRRIVKPKPKARGRLQVQKAARRTRKSLPKPIYLSTKPKATPPAGALSQTWEDSRIPDFYGEDKLLLLARDPWWMYAYWEVTPGREKQVLWSMSSNEVAQAKKVLRVYDVTHARIADAHDFFDIELNEASSNWYVDLGKPDREWMAEIGFRTAEGKFYAMARSNRIKTPPFGLSEVLDEEWMMPEGLYEQILAMSGGLGLGAHGSSMEIRKLLERNLRQTSSSTVSKKV